MRRRGYSGDFWPSPLHELLLQAAVGSHQRARPAWARAGARLDLPSLEAGCFDLLPLLYRRLREWGEDGEPTASRLKGVYRKVWYANQLVFEQFRGPFAAVDEAGVATLVFGAGALAPTVYHELGLRRVLYFEALVRPEALLPAVDVLQAAGLTLATPAGEVVRRRPVVLTSPRGLAVALHDEVPVDVLLPERSAGSAEAFWSAARAADLHGAPALVPGPASSVFLACATGARGGRPASVDWLVDAAVLVAAGDVEWAHVQELAAERRVSTRVAEALRYLHEVLDVPVPAEALEPRGRSGRRERAAKVLSQRSYPLLGGLPHSFAVYLRVGDESPVQLVPGFARHLQRQWGLESLRQIPRRVVAKTAAALARQRHRSALSRGS